MRIAHVTATFPPYMGGTGGVCYHNAQELSQLGHHVTVFTAAAPAQKNEDCEHFEVRRLPVAFRFGNAPLIPKLLAIGRFDILHLHFPFYFGGELVAYTANRQKIPLVITYHQDVLLSGFPGLISNWHDQTFGNWTLRSASQLIFTTLDYAQSSRASWLLAEGKSQVTELPNGVDTHRFHPALPADIVRKRYRIAPEEVVFILVAGLDKAHYFKGVVAFLQAASRLTDCRARFLIVGDGDLRPFYQDQAEKYDLVDRVIFAGRVSDEELPLYYAASDAGILPSETMGEAFGIVLLEAMACGKPVIASRLPGVRVVVQDGQDGLLFTPGNIIELAEKMRILIEQPSLRQRMGGNGRRKVEKLYSWPVIGQRLEQIYRDLIAKRGA